MKKVITLNIIETTKLQNAKIVEPAEHLKSMVNVYLHMLRKGWIFGNVV